MDCTQQQVTRLSCFEGDSGGFLISNFAYQNDVRVLPQNRAQTSGESDSCLRINLHLIHAFELIFDGIFDGDDVLGWRLQPVECCVESRALATASWPAHQNHALRPA